MHFFAHPLEKERLEATSCPDNFENSALENEVFSNPSDDSNDPWTLFNSEKISNQNDLKLHEEIKEKTFEDEDTFIDILDLDNDQLEKEGTDNENTTFTDFFENSVSNRGKYFCRISKLFPLDQKLILSRNCEKNLAF